MNKTKIFYRPEMAYSGENNSYSNSPRKPRLFVERLQKRADFNDKFEIDGSFAPFNEDDFKVAHTEKYVEAFFNGTKPLCESNSIAWTADFADTVRYTNASLHAAIEHSLLNPDILCCSPTSGFHHARPDEGCGFCTFSGQVIASIKLLRKHGVHGCYLDLDGHFGNSIEDHKCVNQEAKDAIRLNINPYGKTGIRYLSDLKLGLNRFKLEALNGGVDYVVWCHGADSHEDDDIGDGYLNTKDWVECTNMFVETIKEIEKEIGKSFPVSYAMFGGYREDYETVLDLHELDAEALLNLR